MVYPEPKFLIFESKIASIIFLRMETDFFDPMLSRKAFTTNSL